MILQLTRSFFFFFSILIAIVSCDQKESVAIHDTGEKPEDNRFTPVVLTPEGGLDEPMAFQVAEDLTVYIAERKGAVKKFDPKTKTVKVITKLSVFNGNEQGLIGLSLDPGFETNNWIYLHYAPENESVFKLARYTLANDTITDEKILLKIPVDRESTSHTGGGMAWDKDGNLFLTVGNNTGNNLLAQTDERKGYENMDDQRGASNTNDLRGKILRIHPEADGTYTIPKGNLFAVGTEKTRPEIYTMGHRNVWRVSVDSKTGWIYWGEIGPDKDNDSETGPRGYDEQNQAKGPGFFGWPYFIADNQVIPKFDYVKSQLGEKLDPQKPRNTSPNNTGLVDLPPAQPALIYYPYGPSEKFPLVGSSSRCAIGGPVYHRADFKNPERPFPSYYEGKWLMADYSRFWIMAVTLDENGNYKSMEHFAPHYRPVQPLDIKFGPDGGLYVLEYGSNTIRSAAESRLVRIEYNAGNRKPMAIAKASKRGGAVPFKVTVTAEGSKDYDGDVLSYQWKLLKDEKEIAKSTEMKSTFDITEPGIYTAVVTVKDAKGDRNDATVRLVAGNEPPKVSMNVTGNKTFFFDNTALSYDVAVEDREDGALNSGKISPDEVAISIDYASEGFDYAVVNLSHAELDASTSHAVALAMMKKSDCRTCHTVDVPAVGPSFKQIADRYDANPRNIDSLSNRIIGGSSGIWKMDNNMPAHPTMSMNDARNIVRYILSVNDGVKQTRPPKADYMVNLPEDDNGRGTLILRAAYTDKGYESTPKLTTDTVVVLRSPKLKPLQADEIAGGALRDQLDEYIFLTVTDGSRIAYKNVDLTGVGSILIRANWHLYDIYPGGKVEIRLGSPEGTLIGETTLEREQYNTRYRGAFDGLTNPTPEQVERTKRYPPLKLSAFFARGVDKNEFTIPSIATLKPTTGKHDLYFVFRSLTPGVNGGLFPLAGIELKLK